MDAMDRTCRRALQGMISGCILFGLFLSSCAEEGVSPFSEMSPPGLQSRYTWTRVTTSDDPASTTRFDTLSATIEGYIDFYRGRENVAQISTSEGITYMAFNPDRSLTTQERIVFPGLFSSDPLWLTWPFDGEETTLVLADTLVGTDRVEVRATWHARPAGRRNVVLMGEEFRGYDLDYTFTHEIPSEEFVRSVEGTATYIPSLGWRSRVDETTHTISAGDTISTTHRLDRLVGYILTPTR